METENVVLGKIDLKKCYLNNGKYGHYLNHDGKNYKVPEWLAPEKLDIEMAERLIEYNKKRCPPSGVKQRQQLKLKVKARVKRKQ